jgi:hypothetical protein
MKFLIALMVVLAVSNTQEDECEMCTTRVTALGKYLLTPPEVATTIEGLVRLVCTPMPELGEVCEEFVSMYWESIATGLFNKEHF